MKIAISAMNADINSTISSNFGRAPYFAIYDMENDSTEFIDNSKSTGLSHGAGPQTVKSLFDLGVRAVFTGNLGPKAEASLQSAGMKAFLNVQGSIADVISRIKEKEYSLG